LRSAPSRFSWDASFVRAGPIAPNSRRTRAAARLFSDARVQFPIRYYIIAMLFVIFDIEIVFMFPWAVAFKKLGLVGLVEMVVFIGILIVGFWYAWKKGALEWD
jgi:NADH:ubiquinone oxidoreductase subunit 3 (subunit A)